MKDCQLCDGCKFIKDSSFNKVYYEIHITVEYDRKFLKYCELNGIKVINIFLGSEIPNQLMTSISKSFESDFSCYRYVSVLRKNIIKNNFKIDRIKIECSPNNKKAINYHLNYFESHFSVLNPDNRLNKLSNLHKSRNLLKKSNKTIQMLTYRKTCKINEFNEDVFKIENKLKNMGYILDKVIVEYCLYDSNIKLDKDWFDINKI